MDTETKASTRVAPNGKRYAAGNGRYWYPPPPPPACLMLEVNAVVVVGAAANASCNQVSEAENSQEVSQRR